jgi:hypothetical protein
MRDVVQVSTTISEVREHLIREVVWHEYLSEVAKLRVFDLFDFIKQRVSLFLIQLLRVCIKAGR